MLRSGTFSLVDRMPSEIGHHQTETDPSPPRPVSSIKPPRFDGLNLHIYPSTFTHETRMLRISHSLGKAEVFPEIHLLALWGEGLKETENLGANRLVWRVKTGFSRRFGRGKIAKILTLFEWMGRIFLHYRKLHVSCVNPHSLTVLPLAVAFKLTKGCRIVYDTHELEPETVAAGPFRRRLAHWVERALMPFVDEVVVTTAQIGRWYETRYGLSKAWVIRNYPYRRTTALQRNGELRRSLGLSLDTTLFIYQGLLSPGRSIELLLRAFARLSKDHPDKHIVFMGNGPLKGQVLDFVERFPNIHHFPPVQPEQVVEYASSADIGLSLIENVCLSYYHSCPNKLLEGLSSGRPVIVSDFPEMASVINECGAGWAVPPETEPVMKLIASLRKEEIAEKTQRAETWSASHNWENLEAELFRVYQSLISTRREHKTVPIP